MHREELSRENIEPNFGMLKFHSPKEVVLRGSDYI